MKTFRQFSNHVVTALVCGLTAAAVLLLAFVLFFIVKEALPLFDTVGVSDFLLGQKWMPVDYTGVTSFGIFNFIAATAYVSLTGLVLAAGIGLGTAMFLAFQATPRMRTVMYPLIDLLAGIPSVIYGFIGLSVLVKLFLKAGVHTGSCVLAAGILLAVMLLPYLVSSCCDTMLKERKKYLEASAALGVSDWYAAATMILPAAMPNMLISMVLAVGRAMGETMAVMMVMGNANLFPKEREHRIGHCPGNGNRSIRKSSLPCAVRGRYGTGGTFDDDQSGNSYGAKIFDGRKCSMRWIGTLTRFWAWLSTALVGLIILFLFSYVFEHGAGNISLEFLTQSPKGMVLGSEGGISGLPSIVLGLFSYTVLVRDLGLGRCILSASAALAIMILPFIEVRAEKAFREVPESVVQSACALGCSKAYTIRKVVFPACRGELVSGMILGGCYAMGATAPVMFTGAVAYATVPHSLLAPAMSLPLHLYLLLSQGATSMPAVYGTAFVMMVLILVGNMVAAAYAEHCRRQWNG